MSVARALRNSKCLLKQYKTSFLSLRSKSDSVDKDVPYESSVHRHKEDASTKAAIPSEADVVVIGGGSIGCSAAYHLAKKNCGSVVHLEKHRITSGTTWHTAGILWSFRGSESETLMQLQTRELISEILPKETGLEAGWINTGTVLTAKNKSEYQDTTKLTSFAKGLGVEIIELKPEEVPDIHPLINTKDLYRAVYSPGDGTIDPATYCMAYVKAASNYGAKMFENCGVTGIRTEDDSLGRKRVVAVETDQGIIQTNNVVNCAGAWAPYVGKMAGVRVPQLTFRHAYVVTQGIQGILNTPMIRDHGTVYIKPQGDALQFGGYEMNPILVEDLPGDFAFGLYDLDWDIFSEHIDAAVNRVPAIGDAGIRSTVCGPESFTPDGRPNMGESPDLRGFFLGSGFNSGGMMLGGGAGRQLAHWVVHGRPEIDLFNCDMRRYQTSYSDYNKWLMETCHERFAKRYSLVYPHDHNLGGRNQRKTKLHPDDAKRGALFGCRYGFERPAYYVRNENGNPNSNLEVLEYDYYGSYDHAKNEPYPYCDAVLRDCTYNHPESDKLVARECLTARTSAILLDSSYMAKIYISGRDADRLIARAFTRDLVNSKDGQFVYTLMLNDGAGIEGDVIATRIITASGEKEYYVTFSSSGTMHCKAHLQRIAEQDGLKCKVEDRTEENSILSVQGPKSRALLAPLLKDKDILKKLKYSQWKKGTVAGCDAMIGRLSFVGELGFEIHCSSEDVKQIHEAIMSETDQHGACLAGYRAMESLSSETGFHHWGHTIHASDNPMEARLSQFCSKKGNYLGSEALRNIKTKPLDKILACFTIDADVPMFGHEAIWRNDQVVGFLRHADTAYALNTNLGYGYVTLPSVNDEILASGKYAIERMAVKYPAKVHAISPFDPKFERIRGKYDSQVQEQLLGRLSSL